MRAFQYVAGGVEGDPKASSTWETLNHQRDAWDLFTIPGSGMDCGLKRGGDAVSVASKYTHFLRAYRVVLYEQVRAVVRNATSMHGLFVACGILVAKARSCIPSFVGSG